MKFEIGMIIFIVLIVSIVTWVAIVTMQSDKKCEELGGVVIGSKCIANLKQINL